MQITILENKKGKDMGEIKRNTYKEAHRHRVRYRGDNMYVYIDPGRKEVFISRIEHPENNDNDLTMAGIDTITRLTSKLWQELGDLDLLVEQLGKASRVKHDIPGILHTLLEDYKEC